ICCLHLTSLKAQKLNALKEGDSLTLTAYFDDCGEWGGHDEKIIIIKEKDEFLATYFKYSSMCESGKQEDSVIKVLVKKSKILTVFDSTNIEKFIDDLVEATNDKEHNFPSGNAGTFFSILFNNSKSAEIYDYTKGKYWGKFSGLVNGIFTQ